MKSLKMFELDDAFRTKTLRMSHPSSLVGLETSQAIDASGPQKAKGDCHLATPDITLNTSAPYKSLQLLLEILEQTSSFRKWQYKITTIVNISAISTFTSLQMWWPTSCEWHNIRNGQTYRYSTPGERLQWTSNPPGCHCTSEQRPSAMRFALARFTPGKISASLVPARMTMQGKILEDDGDDGSDDDDDDDDDEFMRNENNDAWVRQ